MKYILDSNAFDYILDNKISLELVQSKGTFYTSNVQKSELYNIKDDGRCKSLLEIYQKIKQEKLDSQVGEWIDDLLWDDDEIWHDQPTEEYIDLKDGKQKDAKDAIIGALAKRKDITLVSNDKKFLAKCERYGISHITTKEFFE